MIKLPSLCQACQRLNADATCDAFEDGIPDAILLYGRDHRQPYSGDNGVRFALNHDKQREFNEWSRLHSP